MNSDAPGGTTLAATSSRRSSFTSCFEMYLDVGAASACSRLMGRRLLLNEFAEMFISIAPLALPNAQQSATIHRGALAAALLTSSWCTCGCASNEITE